MTYNETERIPTHTKIFLPIMCNAFRYVLIMLYTMYNIKQVSLSLSELFPHLNGFLETADQWGSDNWCSAVPL